MMSKTTTFSVLILEKDLKRKPYVYPRMLLYYTKDINSRS